MFRLLSVDINGTSETSKDIPKCQKKYVSEAFFHQIHYFVSMVIARNNFSVIVNVQPSSI